METILVSVVQGVLMVVTVFLVLYTAILIHQALQNDEDERK